MVLDEKFEEINEAAARLYKLADWSELCRSEAMQRDVGAALDRLLGSFGAELDALVEQYGEGS